VQSRIAKGKEKEKNVKEKDKDEREDSKNKCNTVVLLLFGVASCSSLISVVCVYLARY
jgi:uncharacterized OsmC-like protein